MTRSHKLREETHWMVYDADGFYAEHTLCPTRNWARDVQQEKKGEYYANWRIKKVKVREA